MSLSEYLSSLGYTDDEIQETLLRLEVGFDLPDQVILDVRNFYHLSIDF